MFAANLARFHLVVNHLRTMPEVCPPPPQGQLSTWHVRWEFPPFRCPSSSHWYNSLRCNSAKFFAFKLKPFTYALRGLTRRCREAITGQDLKARNMRTTENGLTEQDMSPFAIDSMIVKYIPHLFCAIAVAFSGVEERAIRP